MKTTKKLSINKILLPAAGLIASLAVFAVPAIPNINSASADNGYTYIQPANDNLSVATFSAGANPVYGQALKVSYKAEEMDIVKYNWSDVKYFDVSFNINEDLIPESLSGDYSFEYSVSWTPIDYATSLPDNNAENIIQSIYSDTVSDKSKITNSVRFYVDDAPKSISDDIIYTSGDLKLGKKYTDNGGWGLYQFYLTINDFQEQRGVSKLFYLTPTDVKDIDTALQIKPSRVSSNKQMNAAYLFKINDAYKYVKRNQIKWTVEGTSASNQKYVLLPMDKTSTEYESILPNNNYDRSGTTFLFDFEQEGTWTVSCTITSQSSPDIFKSAKSDEFSTVKTISTGIIIGIVAGAVALVMIALAIIIVVSKKKERIW